MALTPKQRKAALEKGLSVNLSTDDDSKYRSPDPSAARQLFARSAEVTRANSLPADGRPAVLPADGVSRQTVDREPYRQTGSPRYRQTGSNEAATNIMGLPADGRPVGREEPEETSIPLAPVQWAIWQALKEAEVSGNLVSYRKLAQVANASIRGVRDALAVIEKEGGLRAKVTVRTPDEQGMRVTLNALIP